MGSPRALLTAQKHLALAPLPLEVRRVVEQVMSQVQKAELYGAVHPQDVRHESTSITTHEYDKHS
jgi:hypothetical protein